ncbi:MAG: tetraacyldisaccharide 4'-kinase [Salinivirgaceae bacterium]
MRWYLIPVSIIFRFIVFLRNKLFDWGLLKSKSYPLPIISIGNITVGGTGKTPHAEYLLNWLEQNYRIVLLSRGYKRKTKGFFEVQTESSVAQAGDEPLQIKQKFPAIRVVVDEKRVHAIDTLINDPNPPELIVLDDAFQHRYVNPGLKILLIDYQRPINHDYMLPAGNLREPARNLKRADIIIVTKCSLPMLLFEFKKLSEEMKMTPNQELFFTSVAYGDVKPVFENNSIPDIPFLTNSEVLVVTGIANPIPFYNRIEEMGAKLHTMAFPDHHSFTETDCQQLTALFEKIPGKINCIITTEKDAMRMRSADVAPFFKKLPIYYIPITIKFLNEGEEKFRNRIMRYLKENIS